MFIPRLETERFTPTGRDPNPQEWVSLDQLRKQLFVSGSTITVGREVVAMTNKKYMMPWLAHWFSPCAFTVACGNFPRSCFSPSLHSKLLYSHPRITRLGTSAELCKQLNLGHVQTWLSILYTVNICCKWYWQLHGVNPLGYALFNTM